MEFEFWFCFSIVGQVRELKSKLGEDENNTVSNPPTVKEEILIMESESKNVVDHLHSMTTSASMGGGISSENSETNQERYNSNNNKNKNGSLVVGISLFGDLKDGSSDSDSSAILNEENNSPKNAAISSSSSVLNQQRQQQQQQQQLSSCFQFSDYNREINSGITHQKPNYQHYQQFVRMEEHNFFGAEETCDFFTDDQAPTLQWCYPDQWN